MIQLLAGLLVLTGTLEVQEKKSASSAKIEFRRVETQPAEGLIEADGPKNSEKIYLHKKVELDNKDISSALPDFDPMTRDFLVHLTFTDEGAKKMAAFSRQSIKKRLAILVDGNVVSVFIVISDFFKYAVLYNLNSEFAYIIVYSFGVK